MHRHAVLEALHRLVVALAGHSPLLIVVDDLHWVDEPSLRLLAYLAPRPAEVSAVLLTAVRPAEPGTDVALLDRVVSDPAVEVLRVPVNLHSGHG